MSKLLIVGGVAALWASMLLSLSSRVEAGPILIGYSENTSQFTMTVTGEDFDSDETHIVAEGTDWGITANISEDAGFVNDALSINGTAQHAVPPHGEGVNPNIYAFSITVDADDYDPGAHAVGPMTATRVHGPHLDSFTIKLNFTVVTTANFDDISGYTLTLSGDHAVPVGGLSELTGELPAEVPAGASMLPGGGTIALVAAVASGTALSLGWIARRRRTR